MEPEEPAVTGEHERTVSAPTSTQSTILSPPAREALLKELLITPQDIAVFSINPIEFPHINTENISLYQDRLFLCDFFTNHQITRQACEIYYSHNTFFYHIDLIPEALKDQTDTRLKNGTIKVKDLVTKIKICVDEHRDGSDYQTCTRLRELFHCTRAQRTGYLHRRRQTDPSSFLSKTKDSRGRPPLYGAPPLA